MRKFPAFAIAAVLCAAASQVLANERSIFHFPTSEDVFRMQRIARADNEQGWPFAIPSGYLLCAWVLGSRTVYFAEPPPEGEEIFPRIVIVSTDPMELVIGNIGQGDLYPRTTDVAALIRQVAPFARLGRRLCDQPRGTDIGPGEL